MSDEKNAPSENVQALADSLLEAGTVDPRNNPKPRIIKAMAMDSMPEELRTPSYDTRNGGNKNE